MLIDTHAHLNFNAFQNDADEVIRRSLDGSTSSPPVWMINVGSNYETSKKAIEIAQKYPNGVFATVGLHPINLDTGLVKIKYDEEEGSHLENEFNYEEYKKLALLGSRLIGDPPTRRVVAIGEIGLDYYWRPKTTKKKEIFKQKQKELLFKQLSLAKELNLPVIFHCRVAHDELYEFLISNFQFPISKLKGVIHGFVGSVKQLGKYLELGLYIGFNGIIFKKIEGINFEEIIKNTPLERILIETDCPYLLPPPAEAAASAGSKISRNEPLFVKYVVQEIARIKNISFEKLAELTTKNTKNLFGI
jgi:TatD DNase family protein